MIRVILRAVLACVVLQGSVVFADDPAIASPPPPPIEERYEQLISGRSFTGDTLAQIEAEIRDAAAAQPKDLRWQIASAVILRLKQQAPASLDALRALARAHPKNAEIQNQIAMSTMATISPDMGFIKMAGVAGDARDAWEAAVKLDPNHIAARYALAMYQVQARKQGGFLFGSYSKAKSHAEALLKIPGDQGRFWGNLALGAVAAAQEDWAEMSKRFGTAEAAAPNPDLRSMALFSWANALVNDKKDAKAAQPILDRYMSSADPDNFSAYYLRGMVRKELGDCKSAIEDFIIVIEKNPNAQNSRILLAQCCESLGDTKAALNHYEEYARRFPNGQRIAEAQSAIKRLKRA